MNNYRSRKQIPELVLHHQYKGQSNNECIYKQKKKIFISWSKQKSKDIAVNIKQFIKLFFEDQIDIFFSRDMNPGRHSLGAINNALDETDLGIIILTAENINNPWPVFEAGALNTKYLIPVKAFEDQIDAHHPIGMLQNCEYDKDGLRSMINTINTKLEFNFPARYFECIYDQFYKKTFGKDNIKLTKNIVSSDYKLTLTELVACAKIIIEQIRTKNISFGKVVGINHGGVVMANFIAVYLNIPIGIIYNKNSDNMSLEKINLKYKEDEKNKNILVVDAKLKCGNNAINAIDAINAINAINEKNTTNINETSINKIRKKLGENLYYACALLYCKECTQNDYNNIFFAKKYIVKNDNKFGFVDPIIEEVRSGAK